METRVLNLRTRWINVANDVTKAKQMAELLNMLSFADHARFNAVTYLGRDVGISSDNELYQTHCCGESHFRLLEETILSDGKPVLILEDDVEVEAENFRDAIEVPDDADALYLGTTNGDGKYIAVKCDGSFLKIQGVYACHAILHLNPQFSRKMIEIGRRTIYESNIAFDVGLAHQVQKRFNVYAVEKPFFYQADSKNETHKYEGLTRTPLNYLEVL